jgi:putative transposase
MARAIRKDLGGWVYHVLNRRVGRETLFFKDQDYLAFEKVLAEAIKRFDMRVLAYCLMPNHWHLVLWPRRDRQLSQFMQWLTLTHMRRWHAHNKTTGTGPLYQGRFKSFPVQQDEHLLTVLRYVERNPKRANLVKMAQQWQFGSLWARNQNTGDSLVIPMNQWPVSWVEDWTKLVNAAQTTKELEALQRATNRGSPFGNDRWVRSTADRLKLQSTLRDPWRPKKKTNHRRGGEKGS